MPRTKNYNEQEVIEKAMHLFWRNGYEATSMQMLEKEMGINKFSIYASFGNKDGVFLESLKCYKKNIFKLINDLKSSPEGVESIKKYFYDFIKFTKDTAFGKGCLVTNTAHEVRAIATAEINSAMAQFTTEVTEVFRQKLSEDKTKSKNEVEEQTDYLMISMFGLSSATRMFSKKQLHHYIEHIFKNL